MAYLIYTDRKNLLKSIHSGLIRIPRTLKSHFNLAEIKKGDVLFLVDYESEKIYGPVRSQASHVKEERNPKSGPFNGIGNAEKHYIFDSMPVDCSKMYRLGSPVDEFRFDIKEKPFFIRDEQGLRIIEKLRYLNEKTVPIIINLSVSGSTLRAAVIEVSIGTNINNYSFELPHNFFSLIENKKNVGEDALRHGKEGIFKQAVREIGILVYQNILKSLHLDRVFEKGGYSIYITGDENSMSIPFEVTYRDSFLFERNILTCRGEKEQSREPGNLGVRRVLILADPGGTCECAYNEGMFLYDFFRERRIAVDFISRPIRKSSMIDLFAAYDIIHFSGHSGDENSVVGWDIGNSVFTVHDLVIQKDLPYFIFCSSCGNTLKMGFDLLKLGVRNAVTSRWQIPDRDITGFLRSFYSMVFQHMEIGYAFNRALLSCFKKGDLLPLIFILQGENRVIYENQNT